MVELLYFPFYLGLLILVSPFVGYYMAFVLNAGSLPLEKKVIQFLFSGAPPSQTPKQYLNSLVLFHLLGAGILFSILKFQNYLPLNPLHLVGMDWDLALNTTISFITNTNWQAYSGESQLSYFSQMVGLTPQNFLSAGVGISVLAFVGRAVVSTKTNRFGNFWLDLFRSTFYILLPISFFVSILLVSQGVIQSFQDPIQSLGFDGGNEMIPMGPAASQIAIKQIGTNGGGYFGVNSAHPFENPTPLSNFIQMFSILFLPASCVFLYGKITNSFRHVWVIFFVMLSFFLLGFIAVYVSESFHLGFWEGKEFRFSLTESSLWLSATTAASNGSVNSMFDSYSPLAGGIAIFQMMLGEIIFGGVGTGMYGMFLFLILTVFLSGLMIGRTPEYFGKKIGSYEIKWTLFGILSPTACILVGSAITIFLESGHSAKGPHALSQILYAYSSASGNNGSAFAGFAADTLWGNLSLGFAMLVGRFSVIYAVILVAGSLGGKTTTKSFDGNFKLDTALFGVLLFSVILIVCGLSFFPVLALGPILEHLLLNKGIFF
ncbi:potassium-transporting ATPase subunit KdpA [Leptospira congkakensis]|uniref:Potassium-transporting ATPase potassium-binding subunit n=1 Tax=Leptospira congkakensis TaxID=2484932 RepID=A0A4Z1AE14_9LEPT|nr:potassium-transporting ATPase subunit KdpA [Leptospira congkakensis]TGL90941.1 potassium-transporting ATPase subunit KdpA [Leptospira congkakensis]TGL91950.1 potassium-transporting ATPase subunit KdpA [Leptospira congkakensis]TGL99000.1 potassium-transporting ATPase subunit KdpA [Leptospira congkakensis]